MSKSVRVLAFFAALAFFICFLNAAAVKAQQSEQTLPTLRGDKAIEQLKQNGQYDSLMEAVKNAQRENGQTDEENQTDAVGQSAQLTASGGAANDLFGGSIAISGDTAIVGAWFDDGTFSDQGSAYVFVRSGSTWTQQQKLIASEAAANDNFGNSVAISSDKVFVGAPFSDASASAPRASGGNANEENRFVPTAADQGAAIFFVNAPL